MILNIFPNKKIWVDWDSISSLM